MKIAVIILLVLSLLYCGVIIFIAGYLTRPKNWTVNYDKNKIAPNGADITFEATDGVELKGWFFENNNKKVIMFVQGAGNMDRVNTYYKTPDIAGYFYKKGYSILLFDSRGTGESEPVRQSFGQYERNDIIGAFNYIQNRGYDPKSVGIISDSLGSISTIMGISNLKTIGAIVFDSPASEIRPTVTKILEKDAHIPRIFHSSIYFASKVVFGIDVDAVRPVDVISEGKNIPMLFLYGDNDNFIPPSNTIDLLKKVNNATSVNFPNAGHAETFKTDPQLYLRVVSEFFEKNLK